MHCTHPWRRRKFLLQDVFTLKLAPGFLNLIGILSEMLKANAPDSDVSQQCRTARNNRLQVTVLMFKC